MKLSDFVSETLTEVLAGVSRAAKSHQTKAIGGFVCPVPASRGKDYAALLLREIEFDIAITVETSKAGTKAGKINIKVIEASLSSDRDEKTIGESRIKFTVPISMPSTRLEDA